MECYATLLFENKEHDSTLVMKALELANETGLLNSDGPASFNDGFSQLVFIGGSRTDDALATVMYELNQQFEGMVKGYVIGDEEPWVELMWICGEEGLVDSESLSFGIFEVISEMDEEAIDSNEELFDAYQKGPRLFFESKLHHWMKGIEGLELDPVIEEVENIINYGEEFA